jgi:hypothetical protein
MQILYSSAYDLGAHRVDERVSESIHTVNMYKLYFVLCRYWYRPVRYVGKSCKGSCIDLAVLDPNTNPLLLKMRIRIQYYGN